MDVLERRVPVERARLDLGPQPLEPGDERVDLVGGQQARPAEPADVGDRAVEIVDRQLAVDLDRAGEVRDPRVVLLAEPPAPEPHPSLRPWRPS